MAEVNKDLYEIYGGKVKIWFYPDSHRYRLDGEKGYLSSASTIAKLLDDFDGKDFAIKMIRGYFANYLDKGGANYTKVELEVLIGNALNEPDRYVQETIDAGKELHTLCEVFAQAQIKGEEFDEKLLPDNEKILNSFTGFIDWYNDNEIEFLETERLVYSDKYRIVGITDLIAKVNGKKTVVDYKTGALYPKIYFQNGVYTAAYNEEMKAIGGEPVTQGMVINFHRETGKPTPIFITPELQNEIAPLLEAGSKMIDKKKEFAAMIRSAYNQ